MLHADAEVDADVRDIKCRLAKYATINLLTVDRTVKKIPGKRQISIQGGGVREHL